MAGSNDMGSTAFLIGAGRSGTTLLYKLLCLHPDVAYVSNFENRLRWLPAGLATRFDPTDIAAKRNSWFRPSGNAYFERRSPLERLVPMPVEGERFFAACGMPLNPAPDFRLPEKSVARLRNRVNAIARAANAGVFLSKRTANNRRIPQLEATFPEARYVHLVRDGRDVSRSLSRVDWWHDHLLWWDGRTPRELERDGEAPLAICARNWVREVDEIRRGFASVAPERIIETSYEALVANPRQTIDKIVRFLGLTHSPAFDAAVDSVTLRERNKAWASEWSQSDVDRVMAEAGPTLTALGYAHEAEAT